MTGATATDRLDDADTLRFPKFSQEELDGAREFDESLLHRYWAMRHPVATSILAFLFILGLSLAGLGLHDCKKAFPLPPAQPAPAQ